MKQTPGFRVRVFGWSETWRVAPGKTDTGWEFHLVLAEDSAPGRSAPPFLKRTHWTADELAAGLESIRTEIRCDAEALRKRVFLVDEDPEEPG
jgi:hypothetical protein